MRIIAHGISRKHILDHLGNQMRFERDAIRLTNARHTGIGGDLHKHEITPAEMRWRVADNKGFDIGEFHRLILMHQSR
jgi:hypothetical protein